MTEKLTTDIISLVIENDLVYTSQTYDIENYVAQRELVILLKLTKKKGAFFVTRFQRVVQSISRTRFCTDPRTRTST